MFSNNLCDLVYLMFTCSTTTNTTTTITTARTSSSSHYHRHHLKALTNNSSLLPLLQTTSTISIVYSNTNPAAPLFTTRYPPTISRPPSRPHHQPFTTTVPRVIYPNLFAAITLSNYLLDLLADKYPSSKLHISFCFPPPVLTEFLAFP